MLLTQRIKYLSVGHSLELEQCKYICIKKLWMMTDEGDFFPPFPEGGRQWEASAVVSDVYWHQGHWRERLSSGNPAAGDFHHCFRRGVLGRRHREDPRHRPRRVWHVNLQPRPADGQPLLRVQHRGQADRAQEAGHRAVPPQRERDGRQVHHRGRHHGAGQTGDAGDAQPDGRRPLR